VRLRGKIVDLVGLRFLHDPYDVGGVGHIAIMHMEGSALLVRIMNQVIDPLGVEGRRTAFHAVDHVSFGEKKFGEIGAILAGYTGDERDLAR
jgi:hypothetical protein